MEKRTRSRRVFFHVTEEEEQMISQRMKEAGIINREAYLRKVALNGYILKLDFTGINEMIRLLRIDSNNINQIAKHANETGGVGKKDVEEIKNAQIGLLENLKRVMKKLTEI